MTEAVVHQQFDESCRCIMDGEDGAPWEMAQLFFDRSGMDPTRIDRGDLVETKVAAPLFIGEQVRVEGVRKGSDIVPQVFLQLPLGGLHLPDEFIGRHRMPHPVVNRVGTDLVTSAVGFDDLIPRSVGREVFPGWQNATLAFSAFDELENRLWWEQLADIPE